MKHIFYLAITMLCINLSISQNVEIQGDLKLINGTQGVGKVLVSDANGVAKWVSQDKYLIDLHKDLLGGAQRLYDWGYEPLYLWENGVAYDSIMGVKIRSNITNNYGFELFIVFLDTANNYPYLMKVTGLEGPTYANWGCSGYAVPGADNMVDGEQNHSDVLTACPVPPNPNHVFNQLETTIVNDGGWYVASQDEASLIYNKLISTGKFDPTPGPNSEYWTSTEASGANEATHAMIIDLISGTVSEKPKTYSTRALTMKKIY